MKYKLIVFSCLLIISNYIFVTAYVPLGIRDTTLEEYPFMAKVSGSKWLCPAVLITRQHLITPAFCVDRETTITVYLGFKHLPLHLSPPYERNTQIYTTSRIFKHEQFTNATKKDHYVNNIAVVELERPVTFIDTIGPAKLISEEELDRFETHGPAQVIGWYHDGNSVIRVENVKVLDRDVCEEKFGISFLYDQEWCAMSTYDEHLSLVGNVMVYKNKVVGFMTHDHSCLWYLPEGECSKIHTFSNIVPFLKWISERVGVSVQELTGTDLPTKLREASKKIEELTQTLQELDEKYQQEKTYKNKKLEEILGEVRSQQQTQTELDKKIDTVNKEVEKIKDSKTQEEKKIGRIEQDSLSQNEFNIKLQHKITGIEKFINSHSEMENGRCNLLEERVNDLENNFKHINQTLSNIRDRLRMVMVD